MKNVAVSPSEFKNRWTYKFVIFNDGKVFFCDVLTQHSALARMSMQENQHRPIGAGRIKYYSNKKYQIEDRGSFTLDISGCTSEDEELLNKELRTHNILLTDEYLCTKSFS